MRGENEAEIRARLGIPEAARRVLVFAETSHWDPDWLRTCSDYYHLYVVRVLEAVLRELRNDPGRLYSIESVFFLKMFWDRQPERREEIRSLVRQGRLRFSGTGWTQPDTTVTTTEAVMRDLAYGREWLRANGMEVSPRVAYFPDNFGHSPALPSILRAMGLDYTAVSRIDGCRFPGSEYRLPRAFPLPGSSAELLLRKERSLDFVWLGPDGSEVLCHFNPRTYGQGDMLAYRGIIRVAGAGLNLALYCPSPRTVASRISSYVKTLLPFARTPYLFCPIGYDFNEPIPALPSLLGRYNETMAKRTGTYVVLAALEDYLDLVACHTEDLPRLCLDPNPYWTGFYFSRPALKQGYSQLLRNLQTAEKLAVSAGGSTSRLAPAWEAALLANHHDYVTGTGAQAVYQEEQKRLIEEANRRVGAFLADFAIGADRDGSQRDARPPEWDRQGGILTVCSQYYTIRIDADAGGCVTSWSDAASAREVLAGPGNDLVAFADSGGLWRMGHEYPGGTFRRTAQSSSGAAFLSVRELPGVLEVTIQSSLAEVPLVRTMWLVSGSPLLWLRVSGRAPIRRTYLCRFPAGLQGSTLLMDVPGGAVERPISKLHEPTFWCASSFAMLREGEGQPGLAVFAGRPLAVSAHPDGTLDWVAARNAPKERAFGFLPLLANPARGEESSTQTMDCVLCLIGGRSSTADHLAALAEEALYPAWRDPEAHGRWLAASRAAWTDSDQVRLAALKPAFDGDGLILRLHRWGRSPSEVNLGLAQGRIASAALCDGYERELSALRIEAGAAVVPLAAAITTVRVRRR